MKATICPKCKTGTGFYEWENVDPDKPNVTIAFPLYQRSYKGELDYITPRCSRCFDREVQKRSIKVGRTGQEAEKSTH